MTANELEEKQKEMHKRIKDRYLELKKLGRVEEGCMPNYDGIANIKGYLSSKPKIMWLLKESYDEITPSGKPQGGNGVFNKNMFDDYWSKMWQCMAQINYSIHNKYNSLKEIDSEIAKEELKRIVYINLGKIVALKTSSNSKLRKRFDDWKQILKEQIQLYKPNVIIFGKTFVFFQNNPLFQDIFKTSEKPLSTTRGRWVTKTYKTSKILLIDAYHPARKDNHYMESIIKAYQKAIS